MAGSVSPDLMMRTALIVAGTQPQLAPYARMAQGGIDLMQQPGQQRAYESKMLEAFSPTRTEVGGGAGGFGEPSIVEEPPSPLRMMAASQLTPPRSRSEIMGTTLSDTLRSREAAMEAQRAKQRLAPLPQLPEVSPAPVGPMPQRPQPTSGVRPQSYEHYAKLLASPRLPQLAGGFDMQELLDFLKSRGAV